MKKQDWSPEKVKQALRDAGTNTCALAKQYGVTRQTMSLSLRNGNTRCELRIAAALGLHPQAIWPSRYKNDGTTLARAFELKPIPHVSAQHGVGNVKAVAGDNSGVTA